MIVSKTAALASEAMSYAARGWRVIPLNGKRPWMQRWQEIASNDEEVVARWWEQWPSSNVGVALGRGSGIVDIECDSSEAEQEFLALFGGDPPVTCCYKSVRGRHRLFQWRDDLPHPEKSNFHIGAIEVRTGNGDRGAQSVFPPSVHPTGAVYEWLVHPDECEPAVFPDEVIALVANVPDGQFRQALLPSATARPQAYWDGIAEGVDEGGRNEALVQYLGRLLRDLRDPFDAGAVQRVFEHVQLWNETKNRPPLPEAEVRASFASILRRHQRSSAAAPSSDEGGTEDEPAAAPSSAPSESHAEDLAKVRSALKRPDFSHVIQRGSENAVFDLAFLVEGRETLVTIGNARDMLAPNVVEAAIGERLHTLPRSFTKPKWRPIAAALFRLAKVVPTSSPEERMGDMLVRFLTRRSDHREFVGITRDDAVFERPTENWPTAFIDTPDGNLFVSLPPFVAFSNTHRCDGDRFTQDAVSKILSRMGFSREKVQRRAGGKNRQKWYWTGPAPEGFDAAD